MKSFKKVGAIVMAIAMLASSMSAFACANDTFIAYDISKLAMGGGLVADDYAKLYMCPETDRVELHEVDNGKGGKKIETAETMEWTLAFYEADYPHRAIEVLCLDDVETTITRFDGDYADVNVKEIPEFWEAKHPYYIYNRLYSDLTGDYKATQVLKSDWKTAPVATDWVQRGFDRFVIEDGKVVDYSYEYAKNNSKVSVDTQVLNRLYMNYLSAITTVDAEGNVVYTKAFMDGKAKAAYDVFVNAIPNVSWKELTGPDYANGGTMAFQPFEKIVDGADASWYDKTLVSDNMETVVDSKPVAEHLAIKYEDAFAKVEWKTVGYELVAPYRYYQVLCINGIPMDGSEIELKGVKDEIRIPTYVNDYDYDDIEFVEKKVNITTTNDPYIKYVVTPAVADANVIDQLTSSKEVLDELTADGYHIIASDLPHADEYELRFVDVQEVPGKVKLPYIWRYTGGYGQPTVEWKVAFAEAKAPYEIYERKYVDGIETDVFRPSGKYANNIPKVFGNVAEPRALKVFLEDSTGSVDYDWLLEGEYYPFYVTDIYAYDLYLEDLYLTDKDGTILSADTGITEVQKGYYEDDYLNYFIDYGMDYNNDAKLAD